MNLKSINYWSFPGGLEGSLEVSAFLSKAKKYGFDAVELCISENASLSLDTTKEQCHEIKNEAESLGLQIPSVASGLYWSRALGDNRSDKRQQALNDLTEMIRITNALGAKTLLFIPGAVEVFFLPERAIMPYDQVYENAVQGIKQILPIAEEHDVRLGIENVWNKFLLSPIEMRDFIDQFDSPHIGAYLDVANVLPFGYPEQWLRILNHRIVGVHFKDFRRAVGTIEGFVDLLEGDVNWEEVMNAIREINYEGPVVAEMIPLYNQHPEVRIQNTSTAMDAILGR